MVDKFKQYLAEYELTIKHGSLNIVEQENTYFLLFVPFNDANPTYKLADSSGYDVLEADKWYVIYHFKVNSELRKLLQSHRQKAYICCEETCFCWDVEDWLG